MARFINSQGFWEDTDEEELTGSSWYANLVPTMHPSGNPGADPVQLGGVSAPKDSAEVIADLIQSQSRIDTYTAEMTANVDTKSAAGQDALRALLADPMQDNEVRAAASQALYPGMQTSIGRNGELSFTAKPGSDVGFNYAKQAERSNPERAASAGSAREQFDKMYAALQNETDLDAIAHMGAELAVVANQFIAGKKAGYDQVIGSALGVTKLERSVEESRKLDLQYAQQYYGGQSIGDSSQTRDLLAQQRELLGQRDKQVAEKLATDPDAVYMNARMAQLNSLIQSRTGLALEQPGDVSARMVLDETVDMVASVRGLDPNALTPEQRLAIQRDVDKGDPQTHAEIAIGQASPTDLVTIAASGTGRAVNQAISRLEDMLDTPEIAKQLVAQVKNFENIFPNAGDEYKLGPASRGLTGEALEAAKQEVIARQVRYAIDQANTGRKNAFERDVVNFDVPQNELIRDDWNAVLEVLNSKATPDDPVTLPKIIKSLVETIPNDQSSREALAEFIVSQAAQRGDQKLLGPIPSYADLATARSIVDAAFVGVRSLAYRQAIYGLATGGTSPWEYGPTTEAPTMRELLNQGRRSE